MSTTKLWRVITRMSKFGLGLVALCVFAVSAHATVLIDENFDAGYNRTNNNIAGSNLAVLKARFATVPTVNVGSLSFVAASNSGSDQYWGYFTDPGANIAGVGTASSVSNGHLLLGVGDMVTVSLTFRLGTMPADLTSYSLRFGLFDSAVGRQTSDLNGGGNSTQFTNNPGFALFVPLSSVVTNDLLSFRRRTNMTTGNIFTSGGDYTQVDPIGGGAYPGMSADPTSYTLKFSVGRPDGSTWVLSSSIVDSLNNVIQSGSASTNDGVSSFNWFDWRIPGNAIQTTFTDINVSVDAVPEPSTMVLVGAGLGLMIAAVRRRRR
jgi:hypothetical protein